MTGVIILSELNNKRKNTDGIRTLNGTSREPSNPGFGHTNDDDHYVDIFRNHLYCCRSHSPIIEIECLLNNCLSKPKILMVGLNDTNHSQDFQSVILEKYTYI